MVAISKDLSLVWKTLEWGGLFWPGENAVDDGIQYCNNSMVCSNSSTMSKGTYCIMLTMYIMITPVFRCMLIWSVQSKQILLSSKVISSYLPPYSTCTEQVCVCVDCRQCNGPHSIL